MIRRLYRISGRVQGVGFRWFVRQHASALELRGTVRNAADGSVEVVAEGPQEKIAELERHLHEGPPAAQVVRVEERSADPEEPSLPGDFRILR